MKRMKKGRIFFYNQLNDSNKKELIKIRDDIQDKSKIVEQKEDNSMSDDSHEMVL